MLVEKHGKLGNQMVNEKKLSDLLENERRMILEIEQMKNERDQKVNLYLKKKEINVYF